MSGIEKVCEYSGEFPGFRMYDYKRDLIQIMPEYRKEFRGADIQLIVFKPVKYWAYPTPLNCHSEYNKDEMNHFEEPFTSEAEFIQYQKDVRKMRLVDYYDYMVIVKNPNLYGEVDGQYHNYTYHLPTAIRKLKRLVRDYKGLNIKRVDFNIDTLDVDEFEDEVNKLVEDYR